MDIYSYLKKDHRKVAKLMEDLLETESEPKRMTLFEVIKRDLLLHAKTEEDSFYKALQHAKQTEEVIKEAEDEHKEIEKYLKKLSELKFNSREWLEQFGEFKHSVTHHVHEEEDRVFTRAKKVLTVKRSKELAEEMEELKQSPKYQEKANG